MWASHAGHRRMRCTKASFVQKEVARRDPLIAP